MPTTPLYALPYPASTAPADVPTDLAALANRLEAVFPTLGGIIRIGDTVLGAATANFDFASIPATYSHLMLLAHVRGDGSGATQPTYVRVNGDTSNYLSQVLTATGTGLTAGTASGTGIWVGNTAAAAATATRGSIHVVFIPCYRDATFQKAVLGFSFVGDSTSFLMAGGGLWFAPNAINRVTLLPGAGNWITGSRCSLYGLA